MEFEENDMLLSLDPSGIDICGNEKVTIASDGLVKIFNDAKSTNINQIVLKLVVTTKLNLVILELIYVIILQFLIKNLVF